MDGGRSGLKLMFPWERVLPMSCPIYRVLLGNATWAKEAQPLSSQRALCSKSLKTTPGLRADRTAPPRSHYKPETRAAQNWGLSHSNIHSPAPTRLHLPPQASPSGTPQTPNIRGVWRQCPHRSASRPRIHPPYAILTWTPVFPEKQVACVHASGGKTQPHLFPLGSLSTLGPD